MPEPLHRDLRSADSHEDLSDRAAAAVAGAAPLLRAIAAARPSCVVAGPGLGRSGATIDAVALALCALHPDRAGTDVEASLVLPGCPPGHSVRYCAAGPALVLDADALWILARCPTVASGNRRCVVTPNVAEAARLWAAVRPGAPDGTEEREGAVEAARPGDPALPAAGPALALSRALGGVTVVVKGADDVIGGPAAGADGSAGTPPAGPRDTPDEGDGGGQGATVRGAGSPRRCGGQGDLLAGTLGTFASWAPHGGSLVPSAAAACCVVREAAALAFGDKRRSMVTPDLLDRLGPAFETVFPDSLGVSPERSEPARCD